MRSVEVLFDLPFKRAVAAFRTLYLSRVLQREGGISQAARATGMHPSNFRKALVRSRKKAERHD